MQVSIPFPVVLALTRLIDDLFDVIMARYGKFPIGGIVSLYIWRTFEAVKRRLGHLAARVASGKIVRPRPPRAVGERKPRARRDRQRDPITRLVNRDFGWLVRVVPGAAAFASRLEALLTADADMSALLGATPATARILRPLCWMLGVSLPPPPRVENAAPRASDGFQDDATRDPVAAPATVAMVSPTRRDIAVREPDFVTIPNFLAGNPRAR